MRESEADGRLPGTLVARPRLHPRPGSRCLDLGNRRSQRLDRRLRVLDNPRAVALRYRKRREKRNDQIRTPLETRPVEHAVETLPHRLQGTVRRDSFGLHPSTLIPSPNQRPEHSDKDGTLRIGSLVFGEAASVGRAHGYVNGQFANLTTPAGAETFVSIGTHTLTVDV